MGSEVIFRVTNPDELARACDAAVEYVANWVADRAEQDTPRDTGHLQDNWVVERNEQGEYRVANHVPYSVFVEFGHRVGRTGRVAPVGMLGAAVADARSRYG